MSSLNQQEFLEFFDKDSRLIREHEFRRAIFRNGISNDLRDDVWRYLFQFYSFNSTPRERKMSKCEKFVEYYLMKSRWKQIVEAVEADKSGLAPDQVIIPAMPFNITIDPNDDLYKSVQSSSTLNQQDDDEENQINFDSIKIQLILKLSRKKINTSKLIEDIKLIDKDLERTGYIIQLDNDKNLNESDKERLKEALRNLLITFAAYNQNLAEPNAKAQKQQLLSQKSKSVESDLGSSVFNLGYTQGMNEFVSVFISVFRNESIAYWCFSNFMLFDMHSTSALTLNTTNLEDGHMLKTNMAHYFSDIGVKKKLFYLSNLLQTTDPELFDHLKKYDLENVCFCHEWLILLFKRCFKTVNDYLKCFEMLNSHFIELHTSALKSISIKEIYSFDLFICLAFIREMRERMLQLDSDLDIYELIREFNKSNAFQRDFDHFVKLGEEIFEKHCIKNSNLNEQAIDINSDSSSFRIQFKRFTDFVFN